MMTQPSTTMMKIVTFLTYSVFDEFHYLKGTESAMGPRWPVHYFFPFEKRLPQPEIKCTRRIHKDIRYNLAKCSIRSSIFYRKPLFEQTLTHPMTLFYHIWLKTVSKGTWTEEVRNLVGAGRVKSPSFSKIIKEMNQQHWRTNNRFIYLENWWKRLHMFGKSSFLDLEPSTMIHADSVSFFTFTDDWIQKYSSMFGIPGQNHRWILNGI